MIIPVKRGFKLRRVLHYTTADRRVSKRYRPGQCLPHEAAKDLDNRCIRAILNWILTK